MASFDKNVSKKKEIETIDVSRSEIGDNSKQNSMPNCITDEERSQVNIPPHFNMENFRSYYRTRSLTPREREETVPDSHFS
jgi:hypothetical protein